MAKSKRKSRQERQPAKSHQKPTARRTRGKAAVRPKARAARTTKAKSDPRKQSFVVSHHRPNAVWNRDCAATPSIATSALPEQMVYVLKGWIKGEYEGAGVVTMREGSCWLQPPKIKHTVLDYSDDCELLEIIMPADFETVELE
jgi:hypothetical protein